MSLPQQAIEAWKDAPHDVSQANESQLGLGRIPRTSVLTPGMTSVVVSQQSFNKNRSILSNKRTFNRTTERLTQMDDYCQQAKVFTNKEAQ